MRRIGEILIEKGALGVTELTAGLESCRRDGGRIGTQLLRLGFVNEVVLLDALSEQFRLPGVSTPELQRSRPEIRRLLPSTVSGRFNAVAFERVADGIRVAFVDPFAPGVLVDVGRYLQARVEPFVATEFGVEKTLADLRSDEARWSHRLKGPNQAAQAGRSDTPVDFQTFERLLLEERTPKEIGRLLFRLAGAVFETVAVFSVSKNRIKGWMGAGWGWSPDRLTSISIPEEMESVFTEAERYDRFSGVLHSSPLNHELAGALRFDFSEPVDILPLRMKDRAVAYLFGVKIKEYSRVSLADLRVAVALSGTALERMLRQNRLNG